jgi:peptide/nickel transport system substrate-binding protein
MSGAKENEVNELSLSRSIDRRTLLGRTAALGAACALGLATHSSSALAGARPFTRAADRALQAAGGEVTIAAGGEPTFDPYFLNTELQHVQSLIFRALFDYRGADPYTINASLADTWEETDTTLTVTLKQGVKFHNGREVVAQDVLDNLERAKDESLAHNLSPIFLPTVTTAEAVDQYTVKLTYAAVYPTKLQDLVYLFLIPKEEWANLATNPVGAGPFKFSSYTPGDALEMVKFEDYYETDLPYLDKVTVKIIPDLPSQLANLSAGAVDLVSTIPLVDIDRLESDTSVQLVKYPVGGVWQCILINCKQAPFDNVKVRQALNYTVDRAKINQFAYFGQLTTTQTRYLPEIVWFNQEAESYYTYDLEKAKALLAEAGMADGFETKITISSSVILGSKEMAEVWVQDLEQVGIKAEIEEKDQGLFFDDYFAGNFGIQAYTLGDGTVDPAIYLANNSPLRTENNTCGIETQPFFEEYAALITAGASTIDQAARKTAYDRLQVLSAEQGWVINLAFNQDALALSTRLKGYQPDITQVTNLTGVWIEE